MDTQDSIYAKDLEGIDDYGYDDDTKKLLIQARIEARDIINKLEPIHITGWYDLIAKLEEALHNAKRCSKILEYQKKI